MSRNALQVTIVDYVGRANKCDIDCGENWSSPESIALARQRVKTRFSEGIRLEYVDLSGSGVANISSELRQKIRDDILPLPLLIINGEPRISGQFDIRMLLDAVEAEMEIRR